jgi:hypothetical protein
MEVLGKINVIGETLQVTDTYKKRDLVIKTEEAYPQFISIEFANDKTSLLDNRVIGENVKVSINIGGREWTNPQGETKYFNSIKGWRIKKTADANDIDVVNPKILKAGGLLPGEEYEDLPY